MSCMSPGARRPDRKARRQSESAIGERGATPRTGLPRPGIVRLFTVPGYWILQPLRQEHSDAGPYGPGPSHRAQRGLAGVVILVEQILDGEEEVHPSRHLLTGGEIDDAVFLEEQLIEIVVELRAEAARLHRAGEADGMRIDRRESELELRHLRDAVAFDGRLLGCVLEIRPGADEHTVQRPARGRPVVRLELDT